MVARVFLWMALVAASVIAALLIVALLAISLDEGVATAVILLLVPLLALALPLGSIAGALVRVVRRHRAATVLAHLAAAIRLNLPLPPMLLAAARGEGGAVGLRLARIRQRLERGEALASALRASVPEITARDAALTAAAERVGRLPAALNRLASDARDVSRRLGADWPIRWVFPLLVLFYGPAAMAFCVSFIVPRFEKIFDDFGVELPSVTKSMIHFARWMVGGLWPGQLVPGMIWFVLAALAALALRGLYLAGRLEALEPLLWHLPLIGRPIRDRALSDACLVVGEGLTAGMPLPAALSVAEGLHGGQPLRRRIERWRAALDEGAAPDEGARRADLPPLVAGVLTTAQAGADLPEAFDFLSRYYATRFSRTAALLRAAALPLMVLAMASLVAWFVLAMFMPLATLIQATADRVWTL